MPRYVMTVDFGDNHAKYSDALRGMMTRFFGFTPQTPANVQPAQFAITSPLPLGALKSDVDTIIRERLGTDAFLLDAYEIKALVD